MRTFIIDSFSKNQFIGTPLKGYQPFTNLLYCKCVEISYCRSSTDVSAIELIVYDLINMQWKVAFLSEL